MCVELLVQLGVEPSLPHDCEEAGDDLCGAPLQLEVRVDGVRHEHRLGPNLLQGEHPQALVPAGAWQTARSLGAYTLLGCTVAPGFDFSGFELAPPGFEP